MDWGQLPLELREHIYTFLPPLYLYLGYHRYHILKKELYDRLMEERFRDYLLRYFTQEQVQLMLESMNDEVAIAGSFMINFMYGGDAFTPNDIDFFSYVPGSKVGAFSNAIQRPEELGLTWIDTEIIYQPRVDFKRIYDIKAKTALRLNHIDIREPPLDFILRSFDCNLCKVIYYNGKFLVADPDCLVRREALILPAAFLLKFYSRGPADRENLIKDAVSLCEQRQGKYKERGFHLYRNAELEREVMDIYRRFLSLDCEDDCIEWKKRIMDLRPYLKEEGGNKY